MAKPFLMHLAVAATVLFGLSVVIRVAIRNRPAAVRSAFLSGVTVAVLSLPLATAFLPHWDMSGWSRSLEPLAHPVLPFLTDETAKAQIDEVGSATELQPLNHRPSDNRVFIAVMAVWFAGVLVVFGRHVSGMAVARRLIREGVSIQVPRTDLISGVMAQGGLSTPRVKIVETEDLDGPAACGIIRPTIVLPRSWAHWNDSTLRSVLLHETAHLRRHDPLYLLLGAAMRALYWPHPGAWWLSWVSAQDAEHACDEFVVQAGTDPIEYAAALISMARSTLSESGGVLQGARGRSCVESRLNAIFAPPPRRRSYEAQFAMSLPFIVGFGLAGAGPTAPGQGGQESSPRQAEMTPSPTQDGAAATAPFVKGEQSRPSAGQPAVQAGGNAAVMRVIKIEEMQSDKSLSVQLTSPSSDIRRHAIARIGSEALLANVIDILPLAHDPSTSVRWQVASTIGMTEVPMGIPALISLLSDEHPRVREAAAWAMGEFGREELEDFRATDPLSRMGSDPDASVRRQAAASLGIIESPAGVSMLLDLLDDSSDAVRATSVWALGEFRQQSLMTRLTRLASDSSPLVRLEVARVFYRAPAEAWRPALQRLSEDEGPDIRAYARAALSRLGA